MSTLTAPSGPRFPVSIARRLHPELPEHEAVNQSASAQHAARGRSRDTTLRERDVRPARIEELRRHVDRAERSILRRVPERDEILLAEHVVSFGRQPFANG